MNPILVLVLLASGPVELQAPSAQKWSPAQQEIIDQIRRCNDAWVAAHVEKRFEVYDSVCPATEQAVFWYTGGDGTPVTYNGAKGTLAASILKTRGVSWKDLQPVAVQVDGDVAYIYYSVTWIPEPETGPASPRPSRRLTVFQFRGDRWLMSGGSIAPVTK